MWTKRLTLWRFMLCVLFTVAAVACTARADDVPSESQCRPYIEKALKELESGDTEPDSAEKNDSSEVSIDNDTNEVSSAEDGDATVEAADSGEDEAPSVEVADEPYVSQASAEDLEEGKDDNDSKEEATAEEDGETQQDDDGDSKEDASAEEQTAEQDSGEDKEESAEAVADDASEEDTKDGESDGEDSKEVEASEDGDSKEASEEQPDDGSKSEEDTNASAETKDDGEDDDKTTEDNGSQEKADSQEEKDGSDSKEEDTQETAEGDESKEVAEETEAAEDSKEETEEKSGEEAEDSEDEEATAEDTADSGEEKSGEEAAESVEGDKSEEDGTTEEADSEVEADDSKAEDDDSKAEDDDSKADDDDSKAEAEDEEVKAEDDDSKAEDDDSKAEDDDSKAEDDDSKAEDDDSQAEDGESKAEDDDSKADDDDSKAEDDDSKVEDDDSKAEGEEKSEETETEGESAEADDSEAEPSEEDSEEQKIGEDLLNAPEIPENLRSREHITQILRLDEEASEDELTVEKSAEIVLRDLKRLYENSIKPLEGLYKYRDLSNRHFGDPEIFSKPLVLFMGPWSGGKSSILNYLTGLEFTEWSLRTGAEPSPAYFNILMHGAKPEVLDGTQLAADWTFSGLQKFGQGLEERLRGLRYPSKILEKVNIVEIPGILEVRKQVSRVFPFNDACQWFIDRADIIFLVYDPSKLDVGPETEAILDQLKGRESQTRIVLNKADSVKPEELMRVQSALIWNISPLMSSAQPPVMYTVSLWSMPYEPAAPVRLLQAQERELLRDLRQAIDKRIENKIASARRFAVRVRNHAKMVDCYLTTYYNHKTIFGNKKLIADAIIENPQNYHIYEGLSTLTNISRYDLPDPETYRDFFRLNALYEFQQLSATCTYFRGCPITRLDVAIAYDLPELVGKYKKMVETATPQGMPKS